jgi:hypothetical protein
MKTTQFVRIRHPLCFHNLEVTNGVWKYKISQSRDYVLRDRESGSSSRPYSERL